MDSNSNGTARSKVIQPVPADVVADFEAADEVAMDEIDDACIGWTTFDSPSSRDGSVSTLIPRDRIDRMPMQSLVTIESPDDRIYLASCIEGPFAEPDGLRADTPVIVTATVRGRGLALFPKFHGRASLDLMGEYRNESIVAAALRPLPNSKVYPLPHDQAVKLLQTDGDLPIGDAPVGQYDILLYGRSTEKVGFPRHTAILGTTGGGKSTTVSGLIARAQGVGAPAILLDVEGEYAAMYQPTQDENMRAALLGRQMNADGAKNVTVYALAGRESKCPDAALVHYFTLPFADLSPYAVTEILDLNEAQAQRFWSAFELTKRALRATKVYPATPSEEAEALLIDDQEEGWPKMTLGHLYDIVRAIVFRLKKLSEPTPLTTFKVEDRDTIKQLIDADKIEPNPFSWMVVLGRLGSLVRLNIFDRHGIDRLDLRKMIGGSNISVIDLSDTESPMLRNLAIAQILRGVQLAQDARYEAEERAGQSHRPTFVVIEEAHEFLSAARIKSMPTLFAQVAKIAKRGRKRWLSLVFVTQMPQHLPDEVLGLVNNWVLHRISDSGVIGRLKKSIGSVEPSLWDRVTSLAPGQAVVSLTTQRRALVTRILPTPCRLLMAD